MKTGDVMLMQLAMVGLGRMGMNMARRLLQGGHSVVAYNRSHEKTAEITKEGALGVHSLDHMVEKLERPRIIWIMLPAGPAVDEHLHALRDRLSAGDVIIDGGNTFHKDDIRRARFLSEKGIHLMDAGVSGGIWGLKEGFCLMLGGERADYDRLTPIFRTLAPEEGYLYCGKHGAGHFVKMVHNGIEYAMMQAYGEGFNILKDSSYGKDLKFDAISHVWNRGSVIRSWLLELLESAFRTDEQLSGIRGVVADSGEGRWTLDQAVESGVSAPVIALSLMARFRSQADDQFSDKVVAALRHQFGGHPVIKSGT